MAVNGAILTEDIPYRTTDAGPLLAQLYRPAGRAPGGAVVSVHGGRWVSQDRLTNAVIDTALAKAGILVMALEFRMPPQARYPEPVADINAAIRWLKHAAPGYGADPARVGGIGTSSGGHQLMLNAMRPSDPRYAVLPGPAGVDAALAFIVACWPVMDPLTRYRMAIDKKMERHIASHDAYWPDEAAMDEGSPQAILDRGETAATPPLLLIQGTGDTIVPAEMTRRFAETYRARGGEVRLEIFDGEPHTFITQTPEKPSSVAAIDAITRFVLEQAAKPR